jgi:hypothetical protein
MTDSKIKMTSKLFIIKSFITKSFITILFMTKAFSKNVVEIATKIVIYKSHFCLLFMHINNNHY